MNSLTPVKKNKNFEFRGPVDEVQGWMDAYSMEACGMSVSSYPWVKSKRDIRVCVNYYYFINNYLIKEKERGVFLRRSVFFD